MYVWAFVGGSRNYNISQTWTKWWHFKSVDVAVRVYFLLETDIQTKLAAFGKWCVASFLRHVIGCYRLDFDRRLDAVSTTHRSVLEKLGVLLFHAIQTLFALSFDAIDVIVCLYV